MNKFIKQLVESKYNFNIEANDDDIRLSKRTTPLFTGRESLIAYNIAHSLWDKISKDDINYIKTHPNVIEYVYKIIGEPIKVKNKKELKQQILYALANNDKEILNLNRFDVSNITDFTRLFDIDKNLLKNVNVIDISLWDMSNAEKINYIFAKVNTPVCIYANLWNMQNVIDATGMFYSVGSKVKINIDFSTMKSLQIADRMFQGCKSQNVLSNVPNLYTSNIENMSCMFLESNFNEDISNWDVSNVKDLKNIFCNTKFNQDISNWNININNIMDDYKDMNVFHKRKFQPREEFLYYLTNYFFELREKPTLLTIDKIPNIPNVSKTTTKKK